MADASTSAPPAPSWLQPATTHWSSSQEQERPATLSWHKAGLQRTSLPGVPHYLGEEQSQGWEIWETWRGRGQPKHQTAQTLSERRIPSSPCLHHPADRGSRRNKDHREATFPLCSGSSTVCNSVPLASRKVKVNYMYKWKFWALGKVDITDFKSITVHNSSFFNSVILYCGIRFILRYMFMCNLDIFYIYKIFKLTSTCGRTSCLLLLPAMPRSSRHVPALGQVRGALLGYPGRGWNESLEMG